MLPLKIQLLNTVVIIKNLNELPLVSVTVKKSYTTCLVAGDFNQFKTGKILLSHPRKGLFQLIFQKLSKKFLQKNIKLESSINVLLLPLRSIFNVCFFRGSNTFAFPDSVLSEKLSPPDKNSTQQDLLDYKTIQLNLK